MIIQHVHWGKIPFEDIMQASRRSIQLHSLLESRHIAMNALVIISEIEK